MVVGTIEVVMTAEAIRGVIMDVTTTTEITKAETAGTVEISQGATQTLA